jgi:hypothetical protein
MGATCRSEARIRSWRIRDVNARERARERESAKAYQSLGIDRSLTAEMALA